MIASGGWARENALKSHCNEGHAFEGSNLKLRQRAEGYVERVCVACYRADKRLADASRIVRTPGRTPCPLGRDATR